MSQGEEIIIAKDGSETGTRGGGNGAARAGRAARRGGSWSVRTSTLRFRKRVLAEQLSRNAFQMLPVYINHALRTYALAGRRRAPFDRLLVSQALLEKLLISA